MTEELMLIINLRNASLSHKKNCNENCEVSLMMLRNAAIYIGNGLLAKRNSHDPDVREANRYIEEMPIS